MLLVVLTSIAVANVPGEKPKYVGGEASPSAARNLRNEAMAPAGAHPEVTSANSSVAAFQVIRADLLVMKIDRPVGTAGGMFVVPLYAFLTTTVPKSETARTIAANNIVNSGLMVAATLILTAAVQLGVTVADSLLIVAGATLVSAWLGWKLHLACD